VLTVMLSGVVAELRAEPIRVSLLLGDTQSAAAFAAVHQLRQAPDLAAVQVRFFPKIEPTPADRQFVRDSQIVLAYSRYADLLRSFSAELSSAAANGAWVVGVGGELDPQFVELGLRRDADLAAYVSAGGTLNLVQMVRAALARRAIPQLPFEPVRPFPEYGYYEPATGASFTDFSAYEKQYCEPHEETEQWPWVGVLFSRELATGGQTELIAALDAALRKRQLKGLFGFGYPGDEAIPRLFFDGDQACRVVALIGLTLKIGNVPEKIGPVLQRAQVPVFNAIALNTQNRREWASSAVGLDAIERSWQVGGAELAGAIAPTVVASKERVIDAETGESYVLTLPLAERVERLADRVQAWVRLQTRSASQRRVALIYYNYPPGRESVGASYLNVLPDSLAAILSHLRTEGYACGAVPTDPADWLATIRTYGSNPPPGPAVQSELKRLVDSRRVQLLPVATYRQWLDELPPRLSKMIVDKWGEPESSTIMTYRDDLGEAYFVFPAQVWGNFVLAPQPTRGWEQDLSAAYHDIHLPPHHQYVAFYLWLQKTFAADVMVHVGTHATHEWLPGKEVGFNADDVSDVLVGSMPQLYLYIVDDVGEGLQAKRRGLATIITHLTPPLDQASLQPELREVSALIGDWHQAREKGSLAAPSLLAELTQRCQKLGLLTELEIDLADPPRLNEEQVEEVEHHLKRIGEKLTPFGMHTFGQSPTAEQIASTVEAMLSVEPDLRDAARAERHNWLAEQLARSGPAELAALSAGLAGRYIPAGPGNDPVRNPAALPTGKNFYGFDPSRLPTPATYEAGAQLAKEFLASFQQKHQGAFPERLVFNLWGTETSRHEGVMESQILALLGVRPTWDSRGRLAGVARIERAELGRPRVDVTIIPSGLYRDLFPKLMLLLDQAVDAAKSDHDADNPVWRHVQTTRQALLAKGTPAAEAERLASVRIFSVPSGAYGTGLDQGIQHEHRWTDDQQIANIYFHRMSHLYGQGFWGQRASTHAESDASADLLRAAVRGAQGVIHSRSSNVYGAIDSDDFYQYLGGTSLAVRSVNGKPVDTFVADLSHPRQGRTLPLNRFLGGEMRARYLHPKWINAMLDEGYAGSRMVRQVIDNLWGWEVTVPQAVDDQQWQEFYAVYVEDRHDLQIRERFAQSGNLAAYQALITRMLGVVEKGYWNATPATIETLRKTQESLHVEVAAEQDQFKGRADQGTAPDAVDLADPAPSQPTPPSTSSSTASPSGALPGAFAKQASGSTAAPRDAATRTARLVQGYTLKPKASPAQRRNPTGATVQAMTGPGLLVGSLVGLGLVALGWWKEARSERVGRTALASLHSLPTPTQGL
jgi:cobaltochelatase CobN